MRILSVTGMRDEGPFVVEWLAWHRLIGVTDFLVFSNDCTDGTGGLLDALAASGVLTHLPHTAPPGGSVQWQALTAAWAHPLRQAADWMLISDADEFPVIHAGQHRLADLFAALPEGAGAMALPWRLFGNAGVIGFADRPVTAQFRRSAPPGMLHPVGATFFKSLFRPAAFARPGIHRPGQFADRPPPLWLDGSGAPLPEALVADDGRLSLYPAAPGRALAEMHHYSLRSAESFVLKAARGLPNRKKPVDLAYWVERNFNTIENAAALALAEPLAAEMAALMALPGVAGAHRACCAAHRAAFLAQVRDPEIYRLFAACILAAQSAALPDALAAQLYRLYGQTRA